MLEVVVADGQIDLEVLPNAPNDRTKSTLHLPIDTVVEHVEQDYGLVSHEHVLIAKQLDKDLLDELERLLVLVDLRHEKVSLQLLNQLNLFDLFVSATESFHKSAIFLRSKRKASNLVNHELWAC